MTEEVDDFLAHFGVKGMKWGVINDSPSSSNQSSHTTTSRADKRELRAKKFETKAHGAQLSINELNKQTPKNFVAAKSKEHSLKDLEKQKTTALSDAEAKRQGKLTSTQKKVLIGAAIVGTLLATAVIYQSAQNGDFYKSAAKGKAFLSKTNALDFKKKAEFADKNLSPDAVHGLVVKGINPNYGAAGTKNNCRRATFGYEMRRRGFDVQATKTLNGAGQNATGLLNATTPGSRLPTNTFSVGTGALFATKNSQKVTVNGLSGSLNKITAAKIGKHTIVQPQSIFDSLSSQPDKSRGEVVVKWLGGGNHSMAYEIFNGVPVIFDAQTGEKHAGLEGIKTGLGAVAGAGFTRLDNVPLNENHLLRWVQNAK